MSQESDSEMSNIEEVLMDEGKKWMYAVDDLPISTDALLPYQGIEIPKHLRKTTKFLTVYEKARVLGERGFQIAKGARVMVDPMGETSSYEIAKMELMAKKMPIKIKRPLPGGDFEIWSVNELIIKK